MRTDLNSLPPLDFMFKGIHLSSQTQFMPGIFFFDKRLADLPILNKILSGQRLFIITNNICVRQFISVCHGFGSEYRDCNTESCKSEWEKSSCQWRTSLKGGWGEEVACERHEIAVGSCQSGKNKDCEHDVDGKDYPTLLFCCKRATWVATQQSIDFIGDCNGLRKGANAGTNMECESGGDYPAVGKQCQISAIKNRDHLPVTLPSRIVVPLDSIFPEIYLSIYNNPPPKKKQLKKT